MTIQVTATFPSIAPANLAEFKEAASRAVELTTSEPGALQYDWSLSGDETKCVVRERDICGLGCDSGPHGELGRTARQAGRARWRTRG